MAFDKIKVEHFSFTLNMISIKCDQENQMVTSEGSFT